MYMVTFMAHKIMNQAMKNKLIELVGNGEWKRRAAQKVGIKEATFYRCIQREPEFRAAIEAAEAAFESSMIKVIVSHASKDPKWAAWMLERRFGDDWGKKDKLQVSAYAIPFGWEKDPHEPDADDSDDKALPENSDDSCTIVSSSLEEARKKSSTARNAHLGSLRNLPMGLF